MSVSTNSGEWLFTPLQEANKITYSEFKIWLQGLIEGKKGMLPDHEDWKRIKIMMDRVVPEVQKVPIYAPLPTIPTPSPLNPTYPIQPIWVVPETPNFTYGTITCSDSIGNTVVYTKGKING